MEGKELRASARHRVNLRVRYATASDFVVEYAKNLSHGGLFIAAAHDLVPLSEVVVDVELPGAGAFQITGEVAHIVTPEMVAQRGGGTAGAGIAIKRAPKGFMEALGSYLQRLGRRADVAVFVGEQGCAAALAKAGYRVESAPEPERFAEAFVHTDVEVIAVIVPRARSSAYRQAAAASGAGDIVLDMDSPAELDDVLTRLDELL